MERNLQDRAEERFADREFLQRLDCPETARILEGADWKPLLAPLLPIRERVSCARALYAFRPLLEKIAPEPAEGWLQYARRTAVSLLYPAEEPAGVLRDGALCFLHFLQTVFDAEQEAVPFDFWLDFAFCTEEELCGSAAAEYRKFLRRFRTEYVCEMLRLSRETTPFRALEHIAGVHHVAMTVARAFRAGGGHIDLGLMSGAAAGHDIGKFGCRPGERVPYLHYYYTDQWFSARGLSAIGHIAANHSVWDLEIENLSSESLVLVYADFRVKQVRGEDGREAARLFSLGDAFGVILNKLDNVDEAKRRRYRFVYSKLRDFEEYLTCFGVDTTLEQPRIPPEPRRDPALASPEEVVLALRRTAVDHNIRLMHRLSREQLFLAVLESARGEKDPARLRAYLAVFREYFTYWSAGQKEQTLEFLYELLLSPDGDIRRQAAALMGLVLAGFLSGYKKELPAGAAPDPLEERPFRLWKEYLKKLIRPDRRLTPRQISMIRYQAKTAVNSLLDACAAGDVPRFAGELFRHYRNPAAVEADEAAALLDAVISVPLERVDRRVFGLLTGFAVWWLERGEPPQRAAALRLFRHLLDCLPEDAPERRAITRAVARFDAGGAAPLLFLQAQLRSRLGLDASALWTRLDQTETVSSVFLDNLKSATPWVLKAVGVEYLLNQAERGDANVLHIATHFSNLIKVGENVVVRRMAGAALLHIAPALTPDRRNEIAVELSKALETGQAEISKYIPEYLGQFALWLTPGELDEVVAGMSALLSFSNTDVVAAALATIGAMLEHYAVYGGRFGEADAVLEHRRLRMAGLLMKGLASRREAVRQEALHVLGGLFASKTLSYGDKTTLFTLLAKKVLFLLHEQTEEELTFFYTAAALSHIYRFIVLHGIDSGPFRFRIPEKAAFFPGTFDPFSLSHKGIVQAIRDLGFQVFLAVDEFSWSKKAQPSLMRRQIAVMSVADEFDVYVFPHDIPVNLATPDDLNRLREVFAGQALYLTVGSDVVANASSYRAKPGPGSVHYLNHIVFRRSSDAGGREIETDLSCLRGDVITLQLPTHLENISSTRIRENIDLGRDISHLIEPSVQDYICRNGLYLREPQYKQILRVGLLDFQRVERPGRDLWDGLCAAVLEGRRHIPVRDERDEALLLCHTGPKPKVLGFLASRTVSSRELYEALGDGELADAVRRRAAGPVRLLTGLYLVKTPGGGQDLGQLLLTEALSQAVAADCVCAVWHAAYTPEPFRDLLARQGFLQIAGDHRHPLLAVDLRFPAVLLQNIPTTLKAPFSSDRSVLLAVRKAHHQLQRAISAMYPGSLVLSLNGEITYHRLVQRLTELNGVPSEPVTPRVLGPKMCVPFGKLLRGSAVPNTVTKTIHTDKVFAPDLQSYTIEAFPGYAPLESQIRTIHSFRRPVMLVDDLLHSGIRFNALDPLLRREGVDIDRCVVGVLSGRGRDLMSARGRQVDSIYFVPNLRAWFVESTMYPFIGGDAVGGAKPSVPGLTPAVNLIFPYACPRFYQECGREAVFAFSRTCLENSRDILLALEAAYRERYARNLTLSRLSEGIVLPLSPDKGDCLRYDASLPASVCLENDLKLLLRMRELLG